MVNRMTQLNSKRNRAPNKIKLQWLPERETYQIPDRIDHETEPENRGISGLAGILGEGAQQARMMLGWYLSVSQDLVFMLFFLKPRLAG